MVLFLQKKPDTINKVGLHMRNGLENAVQSTQFELNKTFSDFEGEINPCKSV